MITIEAPLNSDEAPFIIGDSLTVVEAAMVYAGRHPHTVFLRDGSVADVEKFIRLESLSWAVYHTLLGAIRRGDIKPIRSDFDRDGGIDPRSTVIQTSDLAALARTRGDARIAIAPAPPETHSGGAGRPSSMHLIDAEFPQRIKRREVADSLAKEARELVAWQKEKHPQLRPPAPKTVESRIREAYNAHKASHPKAPK